MAYLTVACRALLLGVFLCSVVSKVRGRTAYCEFVASVAALQAVPRRWIRPAAAGTVAGEAGTVTLLALPVTVPVGFLLAAALLVVFTSTILRAIRRQWRTPCRCFGGSAAPLGTPHAIRNALLLACSASGFTGAMWSAEPAWNPAGVVVALTAAAVALLLVVRLDDIVELFGS